MSKSKVSEALRRLLFANETRAKERDRSFDCRCCGDHFVPAQGQWIFYLLCDECFARFDSEKMAGRLGQGPLCEDGKAWVLANKKARG